MYENLNLSIRKKVHKGFYSTVSDTLKSIISSYEDNDTTKSPNSLTWATEDWPIIKHLQFSDFFVEDLSTIDFTNEEILPTSTYDAWYGFFTLAYAPKDMPKSQIIQETASWYNKAIIPANTEDYIYNFSVNSSKLLCENNSKNTDDDFYIIAVYLDGNKVYKKEIIKFSTLIADSYEYLPAFSNNNLVAGLKACQQENEIIDIDVFNGGFFIKDESLVNAFINAANDSRFTIDNFIDTSQDFNNAIAESTFTSIIEPEDNKVADRFIWTLCFSQWDGNYYAYADYIITNLNFPVDTAEYIYKFHNCMWGVRCSNVDEDDSYDDYYVFALCIWGEKYENTIVWPTVTINTEGDGTTNVQNGSAVNNTFSFTASFNEGLHGNIEVTATVGEVTDMGDGNYIVDNITEDTIITVKFTTVYNINVLYNTEQGLVTNATGSVIGGGSSLYTFQVHPLIGYGIDDVSITSGQASIVNNASADTFKEYTIFYITSDITVTVTFVEV